MKCTLKKNFPNKFQYGVTVPLLEELPGAREQTGLAFRLALVLM